MLREDWGLRWKRSNKKLIDKEAPFRELGQTRGGKSLEGRDAGKSHFVLFDGSSWKCYPRSTWREFRVWNAVS